METENKKILSIIIPTYNAAKFLDKGLSSFIVDDNSLLNMLDIVVVNDGSTDNSVEIVQKYVNKYPDVYRILNKENGGHGSAINEGVKIIKGSYFKVVDADDWVNTDVLKETICYLRDNENKHRNFADAVLMSYRSYVLQRENTDEYPYDDKYITKNGGPYDAGYVDEHLYDFWWGLSLHGVIYNTQFYRNTGLTLSEGVFYEDQEFSIIPMAYVKSIYAYDKALYEYRVGDVNQSVSIESSLKRLDHYEKVIMKLIEAGRDFEHFSIGGKQLWFDKTSKFINDYLQLCLIRNNDKKQLRKRMKLFVSQIEKKNTAMYKCVKKNYKVFCVLNKMHMSDKVYQDYFIRLLHIVRH
ncbi:glycosyltransferase family A protein [Agathobacter sp.]|uniref:glycosyltransferase family A protein n=1 Tax=Agathobacter sp. TaxID=2021311 RepID=UPI003FD8F12D